MKRLEEELTRALNNAASAAPEPGDGFMSGIRTRQRRRRQRRRRVAAACAVLLAVTGGLIGIRLNVPAPAPSSLGQWSGKLPDFTNLPSAERVWPGAVHRLPEKLPDGRRYSVVVVLGGGRYLVQIENAGPTDLPPGTPVSTAPSIFDARAGTVRLLGGPPTVPPLDQWGYMGPRDVTVVHDRVLWSSLSHLRDREHTVVSELFSARLDGEGGTERLIRLVGPGVGFFNVAGRFVYWAEREVPMRPGRPNGIYRMSVFGGESRMIPGTEKAGDMMLKPWVETDEWPPPTPAAEFELPEGQQEVGPEPTSGQLWNLDTGERLVWRVSPTTRSIRCDPVLCTGNDQDNRTVIQRLDGSAYQLLDGDDGTEIGMDPAMGGRIGTGYVSRLDKQAGYSERTRFVWDRFSGRAARIPVTVTRDFPSRQSAGPPGPTAAPDGSPSEPDPGDSGGTPDPGDSAVGPTPDGAELEGSRQPIREGEVVDQEVVDRELEARYERPGMSVGMDPLVVSWWDGGGGYYVLDLAAIR